MTRAAFDGRDGARETRDKGWFAIARGETRARATVRRAREEWAESDFFAMMAAHAHQPLGPRKPPQDQRRDASVKGVLDLHLPLAGQHGLRCQPRRPWAASFRPSARTARGPWRLAQAGLLRLTSPYFAQRLTSADASFAVGLGSVHHDADPRSSARRDNGRFDRQAGRHSRRWHVRRKEEKNARKNPG